MICHFSLEGDRSTFSPPKMLDTTMEDSENDRNWERVRPVRHEDGGGGAIELGGGGAGLAGTNRVGDGRDGSFA